MTSYKVKVTMMDVHHWDQKEGQGDYVYSKDGYEIGTYSTLLEAKEGIKEHFGYGPDPEDYREDYILMCQIEDEDGYADEWNGKYIVDYTVEIDEVVPITFTGPEMWYQKNDPRF